MIQLPTVEVEGAVRRVSIVQGGMGAGISLSTLAGAVARRGGVGIVSFAALDRMVAHRIGRRVGHQDAARLEIEEARRISGGSGLIAINCMALMEQTYVASIMGAVEGGVGAIFVGAGLPLNLPEIVGNAKVALVPIVSSARALKIICRSWSRYGRTPDAVVLEGPLAGGHLGFKHEEIDRPEFQLGELFPTVLEVAHEYGDFPVIVAGGIWDRSDVIKWVEAGAAGVQLGTRFLATKESDASEEFKQAVVNATEANIVVAKDPGSPAGFPFRILSDSPGYLQAFQRRRPVVCNLCYMLHRGKCRAQENSVAFCICNGLLSATKGGINPNRGELPIFTVGANASRVDRISTVDEIMRELTGIE